MAQFLTRRLVTSYPLALVVLAVLVALAALLAGQSRVLQRRYRCHALLFHAPRAAKLLKRALPPAAQPKVCHIRDHGNVVVVCLFFEAILFQRHSVPASLLRKLLLLFSLLPLSLPYHSLFIATQVHLQPHRQPVAY